MRHWLVLGLALAGPAWAQERPATTPTRDVDVLYRATVGGQSLQQRFRFAAASAKTRIDTPSPGLYVIVDRAAGRMDMVSQGDRSVLQLPYDPARTVGGVPAGQSYERLGTDTIAGTACTEWRTATAGAHPVVVCMTEDGVLLRVRDGASVLVQALRVAYGPIEPSVFAIPADYGRTAGRSATQ